MTIQEAANAIWKIEIYSYQGQGWCTGVGLIKEYIITVYYNKKSDKKKAEKYLPSYEGFPVEIKQMGRMRML